MTVVQEIVIGKKCNISMSSIFQNCIISIVVRKKIHVKGICVKYIRVGNFIVVSYVQNAFYNE